MSVKGNQSLDGIVINADIKTRDGDYDIYDDTPFATGDTGQAITFGITNITNNNNTYTLNSGTSPFVANDITFDNGPLLEGVLSSGGLAEFGTGTYYFHGPLNVTGLDRATIVGSAQSNSWQLHELNTGLDAFLGGTTLFFISGATGDIAMNFSCANFTDSATPLGPFILRDLNIFAEYPYSLLQVGNSGLAVTTGGVPTDEPVFRNLQVQNCVFSIESPVASRNVIVGTTGSYYIDRTIPQNFCVKTFNAYDTVFQNCSTRGGYIGMLHHRPDYLTIQNVHGGLHAYNLITEEPTVAGPIQYFSEGAFICSVLLDNGILTNSRIENGYGYNIGQFRLPITSWSIAQDSSTMVLAGLPTGTTAYDYVEIDLPIKIVDQDTNREYWIQPTGLNGNNVLFHNQYETSNFSRDVSGTGAYTNFGWLFGINQGRCTIDTCSIGYNNSRPNLPAGFVSYHDGDNTMINNLMDTAVSNMDQTNRIITVGHSAGAQFRTHPTTIYNSSFGMIAPVRSPFTYINAPKNYNPNFTVGMACNQSEPSIPNKKWVFYPGYGLAVENDRAANIDCYWENGSIQESWTGLPAGLRNCALVDFEPTGAAMRFKYDIIARNNDVAAKSVTVSERYQATWLGNRTSFNIPTTWSRITGEFTTTGATQDRKTYYSFGLQAAGGVNNIECKQIIFEHLLDGETA